MLAGWLASVKVQLPASLETEVLSLVKVAQLSTEKAPVASRQPILWDGLALVKLVLLMMKI